MQQAAGRRRAHLTVVQHHHIINLINPQVPSSSTTAVDLQVVLVAIRIEEEAAEEGMTEMMTNNNGNNNNHINFNNQRGQDRGRGSGGGGGDGGDPGGGGGDSFGDDDPELARLRAERDLIEERIARLGQPQRRRDANRPRNKEPETIKIPSYLGLGGLLEWRFVIHSKIAGATATPEDGLAWILRVDAAVSMEELRESDAYPSFDY